MLMVILGAGASYDSAPSFPVHFKNTRARPPLADQLFDDERTIFRSIITKYPQCHPIVPNLRTRHGKSLEDVLQNFQAEADSYPARVSQLLAVRYYIRDVIESCSNPWLSEVDGITNHVSLVDQIQHWQKPDEAVLFVTFNYDELLEHALLPFQFHTIKLDGYITKHDRFKLFKLHGSINWIRYLKNSDDTSYRGNDISYGPDEIIGLGPEIAFDEGFEIASKTKADAGRLFVPAIAIPLTRKTTFECPASHIQWLESMLPKVTKILVIGWRASEEHFMKMLKQQLKELQALTVVSASDAEDTMRRLQEELRPITAGTKWEWSSDGFSDFITKQKGKAFFCL